MSVIVHSLILHHHFSTKTHKFHLAFQWKCMHSTWLIIIVYNYWQLLNTTISPFLLPITMHRSETTAQQCNIMKLLRLYVIYTDVILVSAAGLFTTQFSLPITTNTNTLVEFIKGSSVNVIETDWFQPSLFAYMSYSSS